MLIINFLIWLLLFFCATGNVYAQKELIKDLDFDGVRDTVYFDVEKARIVCRLSTKGFKVIESLPIGETEYAEGSIVQNWKNGFEFIQSFNRYGEASRFSYEKASKRIRLIGMRRQESDISWFGANGSSTVNLLTGEYIGHWQYNDEERNEHLIEIPEIKSKMNFLPVYLEEYSEAEHYMYDKKCTDLFVKIQKSASGKT